MTNINENEDISEFHTISKQTLAVLTYNMISQEAPLSKIFELYNDENRLNCKKLLLRCKKMYEARVDIKRILLSIIEKDDYFERTDGVNQILKDLTLSNKIPSK